MDAKAPTSPGDDALRAALDELFAAKLESFVPLRAEIVARLRKAGHAPAARQVAAATKPTRTAWALNQVALRQPKLVEAVALSREGAVAAQKSGSSDAIGESGRRYRNAIGEVVRAAGAVLAEDGASLSTEQARRMGETLRALAVDEVEREKLMTGRLTRDVAVEDPFAGIEDGASPATPGRGQHSTTGSGIRPAKASVADGVDRASKKRSDAEAGRKAELERLRRDRERALAEARAAIATLERSVHAARAEAVRAEQSLWRAQSEAKKAKDAYVTLEQKLEHARERMKALPRA
jgi:hypothetical protein